jgi:cell division cycle 14
MPMPIKPTKSLLFTDKQNNYLYISLREQEIDVGQLGEGEFTFDFEFSYPDYTDYHGPSNLAHVVLFKEKIQSLFSLYKSATVCSFVNGKQFNNALLLIACFLILEEQMDPIKAYNHISMLPHSPFLGINPAERDYPLSMIEILQGFYKMINAEPCILDDLDPQAYLDLERPTNGDANWIIPGKILAMAGPKQPFFPIPKFKKFTEKLGLKTIIRLNRSQYSQEDLPDGTTLFNLSMKDGSNPSESRRKKFLKIVEERLILGPIAVHCRAGLGRTGSLICAYLMENYHLKANEAIGFIRIMRPGSVLYDQPKWLKENESQYIYSKEKKISKGHKTSVRSLREIKI